MLALLAGLAASGIRTLQDYWLIIRTGIRGNIGHLDRKIEQLQSL
jgi:hypothetical protein